MSFSGLRLHHGLRGGGAAPEPAAVAGATPRPGRLACHGEGWDVHAIPTLPGRSLRASDPFGKAARDSLMAVVDGLEATASGL